MVVKMVVWRSWCDGVMAFVDGDDSGQKTIGIDFGIPFMQFTTNDWPIMDLKHVTELNFLINFSLPCAYFLAISFVFL